MTKKAAIAALCLFAFGCKPPATPPPVMVMIRVVDEARAPIDGAEISWKSDVIARTDADGIARVAVSGRDGTTLDLEIKCPRIYKSPDSVLSVRRLPTGDTAPEYVARCDRLRHVLVVAIRADGGPNMPILHLGKEIARTDEAGSAHVLLDGEVQERVNLQLDTSDPKFSRFHPQNPQGSFEIGSRDEIRVFEVKFTRDRPPPPKVFKRSGPKVF